MTKIETYTMKDGRKVTIDWLSAKQIMSIPKKDMKEISDQLKEWMRIACAQLSGEDVYELLTTGEIKKKKSYLEFLNIIE